MRHRHATTAALLTAAALALTGCSSDDAAGGTDADLRAAVQASLDAINDEDLQGFREHQSTRCREQTSDAEIRNVLKLTSNLYGELSFQEIKILENDGTNATIKGITGIEALDKTEGARWTHEDGAWRNDDC